uniref:ShKT domain-containing protein n=1 Tax=Heligmosomoides polygyrus TaxID=6339 RepID=A0A183G971_HELPZ
LFILQLALLHPDDAAVSEDVRPMHELRPPISAVLAHFSATCVDKLNPSTGVSDCTAMAAYCTNSAYYTLMTTQCPKTCGRCTTTSSTTSTISEQILLYIKTQSDTCVDLLNPSTGVSDCPAMAAYCTNSAYYTLMTTQCPKTCGRCSTTSSTTSTTCVDLLNPSTGVSDCSAMAAYCNNSAYYTMMTTQCPKTCGRCTSTSVTSTSSKFSIEIHVFNDNIRLTK